MAVPVLGAVALPAIQAADGYSETLSYRGGMRRMANGAVSTQLVSTAVKRKFRLTWPALTDAQKTTVTSAYATVGRQTCVIHHTDQRRITSDT